MELSTELVDNFKPDYIFFPHWSWIIPSSIYNNYNCVVFHMTDLPYGRGGSPLQNLIVRGHKSTVVSAIKVEKELDAGDVYLKCNLSLDGSAEEIFIRASNLVFETMIPRIVKEKFTPIKQFGEVVIFDRRTPSQSKLDENVNTIEKIHDNIRMLDAEGYPKAFVEFNGFKLELSNSTLKNDEIVAKVVITRKG